MREIHPDFPLKESLLRARRSPWRRALIFAYAPVARIVGDEARLGRYYREVIADAYAEGKRMGNADPQPASHSKGEAPSGS